MCDVIRGELLIAYQRDDVAADTLVEFIANGAIPGVTIIESLANRLADLRLRAHPNVTLRCHRIGVPVGDEGVIHNALYFHYRREIDRHLHLGRMTPATHGHILNHAGLQLQVSPHHVLSQEATGGAGGVSFAFDPIHATYKARTGMTAATGTGTGKTVAIVDSGIDPTANAQVTRERNFVDPSTPNSAADQTGHGTAIKQIIHDLAPDAGLVVFKVVDANRRASEWDALAALAAASGCDVVNVSLAFGLPSWNTATCGRESHSSRSAVFESLLNQLTAPPNGPLVIAAAGNNPPHALNELAYPSRFSNVVAVESITSADALSAFSNRSTTDHAGNAHDRVFLAPGGEQPTGQAVSECVGTDHQGNKLCGTSFAAAHAAGLAAALWSDPANTALDAGGLLALLRAGADNAFAGYSQSLHGNGIIRYR